MSKPLKLTSAALTVAAAAFGFATTADAQEQTSSRFYDAFGAGETRAVHWLGDWEGFGQADAWCFGTKKKYEGFVNNASGEQIGKVSYDSFDRNNGFQYEFPHRPPNFRGAGEDWREDLAEAFDLLCKKMLATLGNHGVGHEEPMGNGTFKVMLRSEYFPFVPGAATLF
jgi:hypothetical protein